MKMNTLFSCLGITGSVKLFKIYFTVEISEHFVSCADGQLSKLYEHCTLLKVDNRTWIGTPKKESFFYKKDQISKLPFQLYLPYLGEIQIIICWQSKSGRIYDINDKDINCDDIEFWFENLDIELCRKATNPKWSLIPEIYQSIEVEQLKKFGTEISDRFLSCLDSQLSEQFEKRTGIKITKRIRLSLLHFNENETQITYGEESCMKAKIFIIEEFPNNVQVCWKSKSGFIYKIDDEEFNCNDIEFWFENFDAELYISQYYPNQKLPFKIKDITYELIVTRINLDCTIRMKLKQDCETQPDNIVQEIDNFIASFNDKSEKQNRGEGVIHNWNTEIRDDLIIYNLDLGSTGISFFKKLLTFLSKMNVFSRVEIE